MLDCHTKEIRSWRKGHEFVHSVSAPVNTIMNLVVSLNNGNFFTRYMYVCMHACMNVCVCMRACVDILCMHECTYIYTGCPRRNVQTVYIYVCVCVCLFVMRLTVANSGKSMVPISPAFASTGLLARMIIVLSRYFTCEVFSYQFVSYAALNMSPL
jgi:hypothetical protein